MKMISPEPNMRIVVGHTGHAYNSYDDCKVVEDVLPEDRSVLSIHGYVEDTGMAEEPLLEKVAEEPTAA